MYDAPKVLSTLVPGGDEHESTRAEIVELSLPSKTRVVVCRQGRSTNDVLEGRVPDVDSDELLARAVEERVDDGTLWTSGAR